MDMNIERVERLKQIISNVGRQFVKAKPIVMIEICARSR